MTQWGKDAVEAFIAWDYLLLNASSEKLFATQGIFDRDELLLMKPCGKKSKAMNLEKTCAVSTREVNRTIEKAAQIIKSRNAVIKSTNAIRI